MNIVYKLTNISKTSGVRFYIGCKTECEILEIDGIPTIWDIKKDRPYYSSSTNLEFWEDFKRGDVFSAEVLYKSGKREEVFKKEEDLLCQVGAAKNSEYYNLWDKLTRCNPDIIGNTFGETYKQIAANNSSLSRRDRTAKSVGFDNFYFLLRHIAEEKKVNTMATISTKLGKERHFAEICSRGIDLDKMEKEVAEGDYFSEVRNLFAKGATLLYISRMLGIEYASARYFLGEYKRGDNKRYLTAQRLGLTKGELEKEVTKKILDGQSFKEVARDLQIDSNSVTRYFLSFVRGRLNSSDIE